MKSPKLKASFGSRILAIIVVAVALILLAYIVQRARIDDPLPHNAANTRE